MKILVLGGTRFFGVHLVNALLEDGHEVTIDHDAETCGQSEGSMPGTACERNCSDNDFRYGRMETDNFLSLYACQRFRQGNSAEHTGSGSCL